jgi:hypothetical protein
MMVNFPVHLVSISDVLVDGTNCLRELVRFLVGYPTCVQYLANGAAKRQTNGYSNNTSSFALSFPPELLPV